MIDDDVCDGHVASSFATFYGCALRGEVLVGWAKRSVPIMMTVMLRDNGCGLIDE